MNGLDTSVAAAEGNRKHRQSQQTTVLVNIILAWKHGQVGCTDFEHPPIQQTSAGVRRKELERAGLVERSTITRPSPSGCNAIVWRPTRKARRMWVDK